MRNLFILCLTIAMWFTAPPGSWFAAALSLAAILTVAIVALGCLAGPHMAGVLNRRLIRSAQPEEDDVRGGPPPPSQPNPAEPFTIMVGEHGELSERNRRRLVMLDEHLNEQGNARTLVVLFAHGWQHDTREDDKLRLHFVGVLSRLRETERVSGSNRPVLGVFLAWPGQTWTLPVLRLTSFWNRGEVAVRAAQGAAREVIAVLAQHRQRQLAAVRSARDQGVEGTARGAAVAIGHSFGGLLLFTATSSGLMEAARGMADPPSLLDLVVLLNPAIPADAFHPIRDAAQSSAAGRPAGSEGSVPPRLLAITAANDGVLRYAFAAARLSRRFSESYPAGFDATMLHTALGRYPPFRTHMVLRTGPTGKFAYRRVSPLTQGSPGESDRDMPFWIVTAGPPVISGHSGIAGAHLFELVAEIASAQVRADQSLPTTPAPP